MSKNVSYRIYRPNEEDPNELRFVGKGKCVAYIPKIDNSKTRRPLDEHITLDFGDTQIMLHLEEFKKFCQEVLDSGYATTRIFKLKAVK